MAARRSVYDHLLAIRREKGAGFVVLIDPDKLDAPDAPAFAARCTEAGADAFFIGGSLMHQGELDRYIGALKTATDLPVVAFPGSLGQLSPAFDALLYLSVVSGRNPELLIGQHVHAAPMIRRLGLEPIPTAYLLIESGPMTTAQYMSGSPPIPRDKPEVAAATALAAEMMGMRLLFTDGGSGAEHPVSEAMIHAITEVCTIPVIVGGGLRTPEAVARRVEAGASFVVVGNAIEQRAGDGAYVADLAAAAHARLAHPLARA
ncbi:MAG TPA: geranylgeranylglyceryl/heptaprenylglyceryl phosphate synthase [Rubricoccaceae bacterium]|nr:geranylgeranylglyceryl/heptaprenylglyceryl phosphate synthase [Rubricoccaceae bacterium]